MKESGKSKLASVLGIIIGAAWYIQLFFLLLSTSMIGLGLLKNRTNQTTAATVEVRLTQGKPSKVASASFNGNISDANLNLDSGKLTFNHHGGAQIIGFELLSLWIGFAISLTITFLLRQIFRSLAQRNPFVVHNAQRLRIIAILIMASAVTSFIHDAVENWFLERNFLIEGSAIRAHLTIDLETFFSGLIVLVIAEIFRIGAEMKVEQDLTI